MVPEKPARPASPSHSGSKTWRIEMCRREGEGGKEGGRGREGSRGGMEGGREKERGR